MRLFIVGLLQFIVVAGAIYLIWKLVKRNSRCPNPKCGGGVRTGQKFCGRCGTSLIEQEKP